jgi:DNA-binding NarL/FixJ family response regulator
VREKEVLKLVAEGYTSKEIAEMLCLSKKTVMNHRTNIYKKLGTNNRTELIKYAIRHRLIEVEM